MNYRMNFPQGIIYYSAAELDKSCILKVIPDCLGNHGAKWCLIVTSISLDVKSTKTLLDEDHVVIVVLWLSDIGYKQYIYICVYIYILYTEIILR